MAKLQVTKSAQDTEIDRMRNVGIVKIEDQTFDERIGMKQDDSRVATTTFQKILTMCNSCVVVLFDNVKPSPTSKATAYLARYNYQQGPNYYTMCCYQH
jgi:hypothetical protein